MMDCEQLKQQYLGAVRERLQCSAEGEYISLTTPLMYTDRDPVVLYVRTTRSGELRVSDLGEGMRRLYEYGISLETSPKRKAGLERMLASFGVGWHAGRVYLDCAEADLGTGVSNVANALQAIGDYVLTSRSYTPATFRDEVEDHLIEEGLEYAMRQRLEGASGRIYPVDFYFHAPVATAVKALSTGSTGYAEALVNQCVAAWVDIQDMPEHPRRFTLLDDETDLWTPEAVRLLERHSDYLFAWAQRDEFVSALRRAA